jgi:NAD(P)-dependent dehydrogenase (short-subunit alcohol dehydrogenase family)
VPGAKVETQVIDLSDLESVRSFTQRALAFPGHQLDVLLNNAGDQQCALLMWLPHQCQLCRPIDMLHIWHALQASWRRQRCRQRRGSNISSVRTLFCLLRMLMS